MTYQAFFNLDDSAFRLTPDPDYYYPSKQHNEALETLIYSVESGVGFVQITGNPGVGKTLLIRSFIERLGNNINTALILYPHLTAEELFKVILEDLGLAPDNMQSMSKELLLRSFRDILLRTANKGSKTIVIIDEAQELPEQTLEELRLLSNLETDKTKLLQIILVGQRELEEKLNHERLKQLHQRITIRYRLQTLSYDETVNYIHHRLKIAGGGNIERFPPETIKQIHTISNGVPRLINSLCERSLMAAFVDGKSMVSLEHIDNAVQSLEYNTITPQPEKGHRKKGKNLFLFCIAALIGGVALYFSYDTVHQLTGAPTMAIQLTKSKASSTRDKEIVSNHGVDHITAQTNTHQQLFAAPKEKDRGNEHQRGKHIRGTEEEPSQNNLNQSTLLPPQRQKEPHVASPINAANAALSQSAASALSENVQQMNSVFLPYGWTSIVIDKSTKTAQMFSSGQEKPTKSIQLPKELSLHAGIYLLGHTGKTPFFFNHRSFSGWQVNRPLDHWIRMQFISEGESPPLIPVVIISHRRQFPTSNTDIIQTIQSMIGHWVDAFSQKNITDLMLYYDDSLLTYRLLHDRPTVLSHAEIAKQKTKIFKKNKAIALQISQPGCIVDADDSSRAVVFFHQRFISSSYSDSGIKVLYLRQTSSSPKKWVICGRLWLPTLRENPTTLKKSSHHTRQSQHQFMPGNTISSQK